MGEVKKMSCPGFWELGKRKAGRVFQVMAKSVPGLLKWRERVVHANNWGQES